MSRYALLLAPSANRVYADQAARLSQAELAAFRPVLSGGVADIGEAVLGGVPYLTFTAELSARDVAYLSNLSAAYALFERFSPVSGGGRGGWRGFSPVMGGGRGGWMGGDDLLRPVGLTPLARYDSDLITIPKYPGKTNEQFTRLLLNLTLLASSSAGRMLDGHLTVCDPLCGRGTTLNQALMYGYDAIGIEIDARDVEAYEAFLKTYLRRKRIKHTAELVPVRRAGKRAARRLDVTLAASKEDHKAGAIQRLTLLQADTTHLAGLLRGNCADVLVADLPYGVAHGSHDEGGGLSRNPLDLLERAVPEWAGLMRPGAALGLSWNTKVARRELAEDILRANGLEIVGHDDLSHRVDQGIERDVVIARR